MFLTVSRSGDLFVNSNCGKECCDPLSQIVRTLICLITMIDMIFPDRYSKGSIHFNPLALWDDTSKWSQDQRGQGVRS